MGEYSKTRQSENVTNKTATRLVIIPDQIIIT